MGERAGKTGTGFGDSRARPGCARTGACIPTLLSFVLFLALILVGQCSSGHGQQRSSPENGVVPSIVRRLCIARLYALRCPSIILLQLCTVLSISKAIFCCCCCCFCSVVQKLMLPVEQHHFFVWLLLMLLLPTCDRASPPSRRRQQRRL